jgi:hypothetical protein
VIRQHRRERHLPEHRTSSVRGQHWIADGKNWLLIGRSGKLLSRVHQSADGFVVAFPKGLEQPFGDLDEALARGEAAALARRLQNA